MSIHRCIILIGLVLGLAGTAAAVTPSPPGSFPGDFDFYAWIQLTGDSSARGQLQTVMPAVSAALDRITTTVRLVPPDDIHQLGLLGQLENDNVTLTMLLCGPLDEKRILGSAGNGVKKVSVISGQSVYRLTGAADSQPIFFAFPQNGMMAVGRESAVSIYLARQGTKTPPPAAFVNLAGETKPITLFMDEAILSRLLRGKEMETSYQALYQLLNRLQSATLTLDPSTGATHLILSGKSAEDAANMAALIRSVLAILVSSAATEADKATLLEGCRIIQDGVETNVYFSMPSQLIGAIFAGN